MEPNRFNVFQQVHKGLRALLYHTSLNLQQADLSDDDVLTDMISQIKEVIYLYEGHAEIEDSMIFPLITPYAPEITDYFEKEHKRDHELGERLEKALEQLQLSDVAGRPGAGAALLQALAAFTAFNLNHMNQEETIVNELLWRHYSDEELMAEIRKVVASIPPSKNLRNSYWMLKGLSFPEIIRWYQGMKAGAPVAVLGQFVELAEAALPKSKFHALVQALGTASAAV
jgi:hemerythrin-like domain-containing protein